MLLRRTPPAIAIHGEVADGKAGPLEFQAEMPGVARGAEAGLFAPFQRLGDHDNTTGVGLGLSVARGFVEAMGGTITATDTPGGGLTLIVDMAAPQAMGAL